MKELNDSHDESANEVNFEDALQQLSETVEACGGGDGGDGGDDSALGPRRDIGPRFG